MSCQLVVTRLSLVKNLSVILNEHLHPIDIERCRRQVRARNMKKTLLLVFIHGFKVSSCPRRRTFARRIGSIRSHTLYQC